METIIAQLFEARDVAHIFHLRTRSFAQHLALNDLYDALLESADAVAEQWQGKYGVMNIKRTSGTFGESDVFAFIKELADWAEKIKGELNPTDSAISNEWDNVLAAIYKAKYKLENLA